MSVRFPPPGAAGNVLLPKLRMSSSRKLYGLASSVPLIAALSVSVALFAVTLGGGLRHPGRRIWGQGHTPAPTATADALLAAGSRR